MKVAKPLHQLLVGSLLTTLLLPQLARARGHSAFGPADIEQAITEVYGLYDAASENLNLSPDLLKEGDQGRLALDLFDEIALLRTPEYNDVLGHLLVDYRTHPEDRRAIDAILSAIDVRAQTDDPSADAVRQGLRDELKNNHERSPLITIVDDAIFAFTLASTFQFGRGLWVSRGSGLQGVEKFELVVANVVENMNALKRAKVTLAIGGLGTAAGIADAIHQSLATQKLDPHRVLGPVQAAVVQGLAERAAARRDEIREMMTGSDTELKTHSAGLRARMTELDLEVSEIQKEIAHLYLVATPLRSDMTKMIRPDLIEIRKKIVQLGSKLDSLEWVNGLN